MSKPSRRDLSLALFAIPLLALIACGSSEAKPPAGKDAAAEAGNTSDSSVNADIKPSTDSKPADTVQGGTDGGTGASDGGTVGDSLPSGAFVNFIKQANGTTTASLADGTISVSSAYSTSGNAFKYVAPNYYGTASNGFIAFPTAMSGDFTISAEITVTEQKKANNACGIGLGLTTGAQPTDAYAYVLMRNSNNVAGPYYVSGAGAVSAGTPTVAFSNGKAMQLSLSRTGSNISWGAAEVGSTMPSNTFATSLLTDGTRAFGDGPVYPAISFNNVAATISKLVIKDGSGKTVFDSATGALVEYIPASLVLSTSSTSVAKGEFTTVVATATAVGGNVAGVAAVADDPSIASVTVADGATNSTLTIAGLKGGVTTITVTNKSDSDSATNSKKLLVAVNDYPATDDYGSKPLTVYPAQNASAAYPDGEFALTFDAAPTLNAGGSIKIFALADGKEVDSIGFADEKQTFGTTVINVGSQMVRVDGKTVYFTPHLGKLAYGTGYYVVIPTPAITGKLNGVDFVGLSNQKSVATWRFTTKAAPTLDATKVTVDNAQTSTADFRSLGAALNGIASLATAGTTVTINVAAGTYRELLRYSGASATPMPTIKIVGPAANKQGDNCIVQFTNGEKMNSGTAGRPSFYFSGANLVLENITLKNTAKRSELGQAETLYFAAAAGTLAAYNSSFISNQDTLQTAGRNWFYKCHIEGNVDFIWGSAQAALFEDCDLRFVNDLGAAANYSLFVARVPVGTTVGKGYVLLNSKVSVDANVTATFGRVAGTGTFYDQVALINVAWSGEGTIGAGMWNTSTAPAVLGDSSSVGWKSAGCTGLNLASLSPATGASASIANQASEYDTRDHILNRVVTVENGAATGYAAAASAWDVSTLATAWGAP